MRADNRNRAPRRGDVWLHEAKRTEHLSHDRVYRPWGYCESVDAGSRYQVKRIVVNPGQALSLQMHHRRAEHLMYRASSSDLS